VASVGELLRALELQRDVVNNVDTADLDHSSRCEGWTIRETLEHSFGVTHKFADFACGATEEPHAPRALLRGVDHCAVATSTTEYARAAWVTADLTRVCRLPFGTFSAATAAGINLFDVLAHTWDIAAAVSIDLDVHDDLWTVGLDAAREVVGISRDPQYYAAEVMISATAPAMHRFLGFVGRAP
jgi:uncharacterized protein (TIGR03086 family)